MSCHWLSLLCWTYRYVTKLRCRFVIAVIGVELVQSGLGAPAKVKWRGIRRHTVTITVTTLKTPFKSATVLARKAVGSHYHAVSGPIFATGMCGSVNRPATSGRFLQLCKILKVHYRTHISLSSPKPCVVFVIYWVVQPCFLIAEYQCFGGACCLYLQGQILHFVWCWLVQK
jgi:hypothetical protein